MLLLPGACDGISVALGLDSRRISEQVKRDYSQAWGEGEGGSLTFQRLLQDHWSKKQRNISSSRLWLITFFRVLSFMTPASIGQMLYVFVTHQLPVVGYAKGSEPLTYAPGRYHSPDGISDLALDIEAVIAHRSLPCEVAEEVLHGFDELDSSVNMPTPEEDEEEGRRTSR